MEIENIVIGDICQLTEIDELTQQYTAKRVREAILYKKGCIDTTYIDINTLKKYSDNYAILKVGDFFIDESSLKPYIEILKEFEKETDQSVRKVRSRYKKHKKINPKTSY